MVGGLNLLDNPNPSPVPGGRPGRRDPRAPSGWLLPTEFSENCSASRDPFFPGKENNTEEQDVWQCCHPLSLCSEARQTCVAFNPFVSTERNLHFHLVCSESSIRGLAVSAQDKAADRRHRARHPRGGDEIKGFYLPASCREGQGERQPRGSKGPFQGQRDPSRRRCRILVWCWMSPGFLKSVKLPLT